VLQFLCRTFHLPDTTPGFLPEIARWKYFGSYPDFSGPRSYVLENETGIVAHGCIAPIQIEGPDGIVTAGQVIDWAGARTSPGSGLLLYRECLAYLQVIFAPGGSDDTRAVVSRSRLFRKVTEQHLFARPLHPWRALRSSPEAPVRRLLKTVRRLGWKLWPMLPSKKSWQCLPVDRFREVFNPRVEGWRIHRSADFLNHILTCPTVRFRALELIGKERKGHALVAYCGPQLRIVDFVVDSDDDREWVSAASAVMDWAAKEPGVSEIATASSLLLLRNVCQAIGMRPRGILDVFCVDPDHRISTGSDVEINLLLGDAAWVTDPLAPFWA
jgi:hypothetical protein